MTDRTQDRESARAGSNFEAGDLVLLVDSKERRYLVTLEQRGEVQLHTGIVPHSDLIGRPPGSLVKTTGGAKLLVERPTLADYVVKMPRGAQVVYPKDLGPILVHADIFPGACVLEAGIGSGALTLALLRAVGEKGLVVSYELRDDHAARALRNIERFLGTSPPNHELRIGDVAASRFGSQEPEFDRVVLDLPEPWRVLDSIETGLTDGGIVLAYLPTVPQVSEMVEALRSRGYGMVAVVEYLQRGWNVDGLSVRPEHRMVAHTGFLTTARKPARVR